MHDNFEGRRGVTQALAIREKSTGMSKKEAKQHALTKSEAHLRSLAKGETPKKRRTTQIENEAQKVRVIHVRRISRGGDHHGLIALTTAGVLFSGMFIAGLWGRMHPLDYSQYVPDVTPTPKSPSIVITNGTVVAKGDHENTEKHDVIVRSSKAAIDLTSPKTLCDTLFDTKKQDANGKANPILDKSKKYDAILIEGAGSVSSYGLDSPKISDDEALNRLIAGVAVAECEPNAKVIYSEGFTSSDKKVYGAQTMQDLQHTKAFLLTYKLQEIPKVREILDEAYSTGGNIIGAKRLAEKYNWSNGVLCVTDGYHIRRSEELAKANGLNCDFISVQDVLPEKDSEFAKYFKSNAYKSKLEEKNKNEETKISALSFDPKGTLAEELMRRQRLQVKPVARN